MWRRIKSLLGINPNRANRDRALRYTVNEAIDTLGNVLSDSQSNGLISLHYASQLYGLFLNSPFVLAIVLDVTEGSNVIDLNEKKWIEELGWNSQEISDSNLFGILYEGDKARTIEAYKDVNKFKDLETFENRYR